MALQKKHGVRQVDTFLFGPLYKIIIFLIYSCITLGVFWHLVLMKQARERRVIIFYLLGGIIVILLFVVIVWRRARYSQRRKALEQILERDYQSGQALVRYVMINRQCSEKVAYQRITTFVREQVPLGEHSVVDEMSAYDRQSLLARARSILVHNPDAIDKI